MRHKLLFIVFLTFTSIAGIFAQNGIKVGVLSSKFVIKWDGISVSTKNKLGFEIGYTRNFDLKDQLKLRTGVSFLNLGTKDGETNTTSTTNYAYIPLDLVLFVDKSQKPFIHLGPYLGILLSATDSDGENFRDQLNSTDLGYSLGIGYKFNKFSVGIDFHRSLVPFIKEEQTDPFFSASLKGYHSWYSLNGIYHF